MDILPNLIGEAEFKCFTEQDYVCFAAVLDDSLAKLVKEYTEKSNADPTIVEDINKYLGSTLESLTFHFTLEEMGILDLIRNITPQTLLSSNADFDDIKSKLEFLDANLHKLRVHIQPRPKTAFEAFLSSLRRVTMRQREAGITPTYPDIIERINGNKFAFYIPNDKGHPTGTSVINSRRNAWSICLRGLQYKEYCDNKGLNYIKRRKF